MQEKELRQEFILGLSELGMSEEIIIAVMTILPNTQAMLKMMDILIAAHDQGKEITQQVVMETLMEVSNYSTTE